MARNIDGQKAYELVSEAVAINEMTGIEVLDLFTNYHGLQILEEGFIEHIEQEGYRINISELEE